MPKYQTERVVKSRDLVVEIERLRPGMWKEQTRSKIRKRAEH